jgi:cytochrome c oxidase subunit 2
MQLSRRKICMALLAGSAVSTVAKATKAAKAAAKPKTVKVTAKKFVYTPNRIVLKAGVPSVLEFTALDFTHGLNIPDLHIRADLMPGQIIKVPLPALQAGEYDFLCDNFCGDGHEEMNGKIIVMV